MIPVQPRNMRLRCSLHAGIVSYADTSQRCAEKVCLVAQVVNEDYTMPDELI